MNILYWLIIATTMAFSSIAPEFPEVRHYFDGLSIDKNDAINFVFNDVLKIFKEKACGG